MLHKWLYRLLPFIALALWIAAAIGHHITQQELTPQKIASIIQADLTQREANFKQIDKYSAEVLAWIQQDAAGSASNFVFNRHYKLFAYEGDRLKAWSTGDVLPEERLKPQGKIYKLRSGLYYGYSRHPRWMPEGTSISVLYPIAIKYPLSNQYLQSYIPASAAIDPATIITDTAGIDAAPLRSPDNRVIGYVHPAKTRYQAGPPQAWIVWCWVLAILAICIWIHLLAVKLAKKKGLAWSVALIVATILLIRGLMYIRGLPFHLEETALFSPRLYATSYLLVSLGDLLCNTLAMLWLVAFIASRVQLYHLESNIPSLLKWLLSITLNMLLASTAFLLVWLIRSIVMDSIIPFDTAHLSSLDRASLAGLTIASLLTAMLLLVGSIVRNITHVYLLRFRMQSIAVVVGFALMLLLYRHNELLRLYAYACLWLLVIHACQRIGKLRETRGFFRAANLIWSVAHCLLLTLLLQHFIRAREFDRRRAFAEHIATRQDDALEYNFSQVEAHVRKDTALQHFLQSPSEAARKVLDERLATLYFNSSFADYQAYTYLFDLRNQPLFNSDTTSITQLVSVAAEEVPSRITPSLYYRESATGDHIYLGIIDVNDTAGALLGVLVIDLEQKKIVAETVLPELLQPATINQAEKAAGYSYAVYADRKLVAQSSDYPFPFYIAADTTGKEYHERRSKDYSILIYTPNKHRAVLVWHRLGTLSEALTIFSYLLLLRFLLGGILITYSTLSDWLLLLNKRKPFAGMSLRRRVQISVMGIVAFSFLLIGIITVVFLRHRYTNSNKAGRQAMMQSVARAIQQYVREQGATSGADAWQSAIAQPRFRYFLGNLAATQKIDINLFDKSGRLAVATQQAIYDLGLLAPVMRPQALAAMYAPQPKPLLQQDEEIGRLRYISCYVPLRTEGAGIAGFLNVPLFSSQRELDEQISSVVVALINLYVAIFLLSSIIAVFITRWITSAFDVIIRQFGRLALHGNEPLLWPYEDEIGLLVTEYNKMVRKVEESVSLLARNEREGAWREMARQVAHEIKNPLTPMKLNVQYLQQAIRNNQPDVLDLAKRVSENLLEQINNLSVIATEFAGFARIGAKPEEIDLADVVRKVAGLYSNEPAADVHFTVPDYPVPVMADRSQLVRIITNLMQNAVQAIPESRRGSIAVRLYAEGREAIVEVADNGEGIPPEVQEKLFTPYFTTKTSGTGLGLAMTRQMVEVWGGTIRYETAWGAGTTFIIRLPLKVVE